ncbi:MAG TPA: DUF1428 domain-containing protein [Alteromonas australica]|jgi:uncharacterized protein YbaA (DUF1428 family)|uniref:DUF1428 domain-containing protein n=1 Tax=Alteromonas australica TaxID=589873 RepID=A0A350P714_9ALTE|nr:MULTISPECIES: DUF1428 domain-containing protein [Alteromonas]MAB92632.1 RNA signal recognition particle [Alteromonas sp.]MAF71751.1 RNA signal recognition particle [Alteromonas sp.]MAO29427.1 RNA signal recognition particle [Alteromonas sp.]MBU34376.1 RNA signal recognition particle [Alteromonas sp.]QPL50863.1 DUF1428 domain-containing protein [Alteromonas sp. B31-7]|tara:strand:- start:4027 stop:4380 length:354 start_codon:yes stop_codon:yes gene_type:complete
MSYIDGFVVAVPTENKQAYLEHAKLAGSIFKEYGALQIIEAWGDDVPSGEITSFPLAVKAKEDETVVFSIAIWPSKEVRDSGWQKIMDDPRMQEGENPMPFDGKRLIYGGFEPLLTL